jgi:hypothetical protein
MIRRASPLDRTAYGTLNRSSRRHRQYGWKVRRTGPRHVAQRIERRSTINRGSTMQGIAIDGPLEGEPIDAEGYPPGTLYDRAQDLDDPEKLHVYRVSDDTDHRGRNHLTYRWSIASSSEHEVTGEAIDGSIAGDWVQVVTGLRRGERTPIKQPGGTLIYESTGRNIETEPGDQPRIELRFVGEAI